MPHPIMTQRVAGEPKNPQGGRGVHRRRGPADRDGEPPPAAVEVRPCRVGGRAPRREGRGSGPEHPGVGRR